MIQWYPGHMKKTKDLIISHKKQIDIVLELLDARIPFSSSNPMFDDILKDKKRIVILNKADLADENITNEWIKYYHEKGHLCISFNSKTGSKKALINLLKKELEIININTKKRNELSRELRLMIIGIPNVGKSSLINKLIGSNKAKVGNIPGVTRGKQWIKLDNDFLLFDTPGILWPKFEDEQVAMNNAIIGSIKDKILPLEEIGYKLLEILKQDYINLLIERFKVNNKETTIELMDDIALKRGAILKGKEIDYLRVSKIIIDEFRSAQIGRISLEKPKY